MARKLLARLTYANVVSSLALFLVLTGGTAVALSGTNTVFGDDIVNGTVKSADVDEESFTEVPKAFQAYRLGSSGTETSVEEYRFPQVSMPVLIPPGGSDKTINTEGPNLASQFQAGYLCPRDPAVSNGILTFEDTNEFN